MARVTATARVSKTYDVGFDILGDAARSMHVEVHWPVSEEVRDDVLVCVPGGSMNLRYFDLGGSEDDRFSFARQMASRGFVSVLIDPPGVGKSDRPADGHALTPDRISQILARTLAWVRAELSDGLISPDLPAMPGLRTIGIGHSMGAMLTAVQQAQHPQHSGLILLGFGTVGLPDFLSPEARKLAADPLAVREHLVPMSKKVFPQSYPTMPGNGGQAGLFGGSSADPDAVRALKAAADVMLPVPAFLSMFPGNVAPECDRVTVPVRVILGDRDLITAPEDIGSMFPQSDDASLRLLSDTGHAHFLFASRTDLFDDVADWVRRIAS